MNLRAPLFSREVHSRLLAKTNPLAMSMEQPRDEDFPALLTDAGVLMNVVGSFGADFILCSAAKCEILPEQQSHSFTGFPRGFLPIKQLPQPAGWLYSPVRRQFLTYSSASNYHYSR